MTINLNKKDVHKIIDDAMEKRDRDVSIFIGKDLIHISVTPLDNMRPKWNECDSGYRCSECGCLNDFPSPFCPLCGEKLAAPYDEEGKDE